MFHLADNLFFCRKECGCVRILKFDPEALGVSPKAEDKTFKVEPLLDVTIDPESWASIVSSVCGLGVKSDTFEQALCFHNADGTCDLPPLGWYCTREKGHDGPCAAYIGTWRG